MAAHTVRTAPRQLAGRRPQAAALLRMILVLSDGRQAAALLRMRIILGAWQAAALLRMRIILGAPRGLAGPATLRMILVLRVPGGRDY
jgi:hypothetical protein